ncbi:MAG: DUF2141 domain-containing protein [Flavobacteriales bacterium]|nr:MAG: DUF2141 domain-containing protein [Flavobacteriales bacterium]
MTFIFAYLLCFISTTSSTPNNIYIELKINNIKSNEGQFLVSLYPSEKGFPYEPTEYFTFDKKNIQSGSMTIKIPVKKTGAYAISVVDDKNENMEMDKNVFGVPKEGFGFSNNASPRGLRPPSFEDAKLTVSPKGVRTAIDLKYY